jgi:hypothetical protein
MAFENDRLHQDTIESINKNNKLNLTEKTADDLTDLIKSFNIIDSNKLSQKDLSILLQRVDGYSGLFTTQQLGNIDYRDLKNHVFFDSAVNKVTFSFDRIHNIPYDKDEFENIKYFNKNDGYTNFILEKVYPKSKGYVLFDGESCVTVFDEQGKVLQDTKEREIGILNPLSQRFSFEFWLKMPTSDSLSNNNNQIVFKKIQFDNNVIKNGYICSLSKDSDDYFLNFIVIINGEKSHYKLQLEVSLLDEWHHIGISVEKTKKIDFVLDGQFKKETILVENNISNKSFPKEFKGKNIPLTLGGIFYVDENNNTINTLTGFNNSTCGIDDFKMYFKLRSARDVKKDMHRNVFSRKGLRLYLRFNEPSGSYTNSCLSIDYSGNRIHGISYNNLSSSPTVLSNTTGHKVNLNTPLKLEKLIDSPVLNSSYTNISNARESLMKIAKEYDLSNPNLIFKLMPRHYFLDSSNFQNLPVYSNTSNYSSHNQIEDNNLIFTTSNITPKVPANTDLVNIVLIWAKFFDKLKLYTNSITGIMNIDYDSVNKKSIVSMQIPLLCKIYGIDFKEVLPSITKNKLNNENLNFDDVISEVSIRKIQNLLWQRFLINTRDFLTSKGTIKSIESCFNSFGIDYTKFIDIKEYSQNNTITQENNYKLNSLQTFTVNFSNRHNISGAPTFQVNEGISENKLLLEILDIRSKINKQNLLPNSSDNALENGIGKNDWSIELFFKFNNSINKRKNINLSAFDKKLEGEISYNDTQTLFVLSSSTNANTNDGAIIFAKYDRINSFNNNLGNIIIEIQPIQSQSSNTTLTLQNVNIYDIEKHLVITQKREDNKLTYTASIDSVSKQIDVSKAITNSSSVTVANLSNEISNNNYLFSNDKKLNFRIGNYKYSTSNHLNDALSGTSNSTFQGEVIKIRMWKHCLNNKEILAHTKNIKNFSKSGFDPLKTLIIDIEVKNKQNYDSSNNSIFTWNIDDISNNKETQSQNLNTCTVKTKNNNLVNKIVINPCFITIKEDSIKIDEPNSNNKVNIISYSNEENREATNNFNNFPSNSVPKFFNYDTVNRVSIDMSIVKTINSDISKIISDLNDFSSKINNNMSIYEYSYKNLEEIKNLYFEKFSDSEYINYSSIGNVFKYFDNIMNSILYDIVPSRVRFEGFNLVYESHALERHKYEYKNKDSINTIIDYDRASKLSYSRESILSTRSSAYNKNRE